MNGRGLNSTEPVWLILGLSDMVLVRTSGPCAFPLSDKLLLDARLLVELETLMLASFRIS